MDAVWYTQNFENFYLANAYLWNLLHLCTFIGYFIWLITEAHEDVNEKNRKPVFWFNFYGFLGYIKNRSIYDALSCITLCRSTLHYITSLMMVLKWELQLLSSGNWPELWNSMSSFIWAKTFAVNGRCQRAWPKLYKNDHKNVLFALLLPFLPCSEICNKCW